MNFPAIWELLIRQTRSKRPKTPPHPQLLRLYTVSAAASSEHARGRKVWLEQEDVALLDEVVVTILRDAHYRRRESRRLLLADDDAPPLGPRQDVCAEVGYNVVKLNQPSRDVLSILEGCRLRFNVGQFREDYEAAVEFVGAHRRRPCIWRQRSAYDKLIAFIDDFRSVYERTAGFYDALPVYIRSRFFRAQNRRFHSADFWPEHVPAEFRERWFGVDTSTRGFDEPAPTNSFVEQDISSSQTQLLAAFLGLSDLEELAGRRDPKFKVYLTRQLWALHERDRDVLSDGYAGPEDPRLVAFVKEHWMRRNYGGKISQVARELADEPEAYGPGWRCDIFAAGDGRRPAGVTVAETLAARFFASLPPWSSDVTTFLDACQYIGRQADPYRGVVFSDPFDGAEIRWNPVQRATKKIGDYQIEAHLPGRLAGRKNKKRFIPLPPNGIGEFQIDRMELQQLVAPCLVHALDAYFNALVITILSQVWHVRDVVAVHDGWFVPEQIDDTDIAVYGRESGGDVLEVAIGVVGGGWLKGLGIVYDQFAATVAGSPYEQFALDIRTRWRERVKAERWPRFTANERLD